MAKVLQGVQCRDRDTITGTGLFASEHGRPAFTSAETEILAPLLVAALKKASPKDLATFYMVGGDAKYRGAVTSGGLFVDEPRRLHLMLANCRSVPSGGQDYAIAMEINTRDQPLLPISPYRFRVGFHPGEAWIKDGREDNRPGFPAYGSVYGDPAKSITIDLDRLLEAHRAQ